MKHHALSLMMGGSRKAPRPVSAAVVFAAGALIVAGSFHAILAGNETNIVRAAKWLSESAGVPLVREGSVRTVDCYWTSEPAISTCPAMDFAAAGSVNAIHAKLMSTAFDGMESGDCDTASSCPLPRFGADFGAYVEEAGGQTMVVIYTLRND